MFHLERAFIHGPLGKSLWAWNWYVLQLVKNPPAMQETWVRSLGWEDHLEKGKTAHSGILAWRFPWTTVHGVTKSQTWLNDFQYVITDYVITGSKIVSSLLCLRSNIKTHKAGFLSDFSRELVFISTLPYPSPPKKIFPKIKLVGRFYFLFCNINLFILIVILMGIPLCVIWRLIKLVGRF